MKTNTETKILEIQIDTDKIYERTLKDLSPI